MPKEETYSLIDFLAKVSFFSEVSKASLLQLCEVIEEIDFRRNETIFKKDDRGDSMYVIFKGNVKIHQEGHIYDELDVGHCFGEYALIDNKARSASVTTTERSTVLKIERQDFLDLMVKDSGFAQGILSVMIKRHRDLDDIQKQLASSKQELELTSSKMSGLIEGAMDAIIMFDSDFRIVLTNPSANELLENDDVIQRNILFFLDEEGANFIESLVKKGDKDVKAINNYIPDVIKVIGSDETETLNEGTISKFGNGLETFYTLILRNIEDRLKAEDKINLLTTKTQYLEKEIQELTSNHGINCTRREYEKCLRYDATGCSN